MACQTKKQKLFFSKFSFPIPHWFFFFLYSCFLPCAANKFLVPPLSVCLNCPWLLLARPPDALCQAESPVRWCGQQDGTKRSIKWQNKKEIVIPKRIKQTWSTSIKNVRQLRAGECPRTCVVSCMRNWKSGKENAETPVGGFPPLTRNVTITKNKL